LNEVKFAPVKNGYTIRKDEYLFLFLQRIGFGLKTQYLETSGKTFDSWERPHNSARVKKSARLLKSERRRRETDEPKVVQVGETRLIAVIPSVKRELLT
jgi:hypothetical protein